MKRAVIQVEQHILEGDYVREFADSVAVSEQSVRDYFQRLPELFHGYVQYAVERFNEAALSAGASDEPTQNSVSRDENDSNEVIVT